MTFCQSSQYYGPKRIVSDTLRPSARIIEVMPMRFFPLLCSALLLSACGLRPVSPAPESALAEFEPVLAAASEADNIALLCGDSPLFEASPLTPTEDGSDLWQRLRAGFRLDLDRDDPRIRAQRDWYVRHPQYIERVTRRAQRYLYHIVNEVEARDMPMEMALLPIVESAFDPFAYSHGRASGLWQFIPSTGRAFAMQQDYWHDGRRDVLASTDAALTYLTQLAKRFDGDWELALASYNAGAGNVSRAIRRNTGLGRKTDFWHLSLPQETRAYVPKLIAISQIIRDPQGFGLTLTAIPDSPYFEVVDIGGQLDLQKAAELSGVLMEEIYYLNPALSRWATPPAGPHRLLVPVAVADTLRQQLAALPVEQRLRWQRYRIQPGDTLGAIAGRFNTDIQTLRSSNRLRGHTIIAGNELLIPQPAVAGSNYALSEENRLQKTQQRQRQGRQKLNHRVVRGDSLWTIARRHQVSVRELASWNGMAPGDPLAIGRNLVIWQAAASNSHVSRPELIRQLQYAVRRGDSLHRIANRFNVSVNEIAGWNNLNTGRYLQPGQRLTLYVDVRHAP